MSNNDFDFLSTEVHTEKLSGTVYSKSQPVIQTKTDKAKKQELRKVEAQRTTARQTKKQEILRATTGQTKKQQNIPSYKKRYRNTFAGLLHKAVFNPLVLFLTSPLHFILSPLRHFWLRKCLEYFHYEQSEMDDDTALFLYLWREFKHQSRKESGLLTSLIMMFLSWLFWNFCPDDDEDTE